MQGQNLIPVELDLDKIKKFKDILYEGMVIKCQKTAPTRDRELAKVDCMARIIRKYANTVTLEDLNPHCKTRKIFSLQYKDLIRGWYQNG